MHVSAFRVGNFRRLKNIRVDLEADKTIFVGANNSGKTSATHVFQLFLGEKKGAFQIYDFTADSWDQFNQYGPETGADPVELPVITFDLWFSVDDDNVHRVIELLPDLDWDGEPVGVRMTYAPKDADKLWENFHEARTAAQRPDNAGQGSYNPWPQNMTDYLTKRLQAEYEIKYFILDARRCDDELVPQENYKPHALGSQAAGAANVVDSLIRVDFLNAQRHLSDAASPGRAEDLSRRLSRFYHRNLQKLDGDFEALGAIADAEARLNDHFADVFKPTLGSLGTLGYPGIANPDLVVKASFNAESILSTSAKVHYALPMVDGQPLAPDSPTLPDQYNGLGFKNLIYMVVEVLDFHHAWADVEGERPPVQLVIIEEPEAHLHAQLQQVFIRKVMELLPAGAPGFSSQLVVTTHSSHILYESEFKPIRYFCRSKHSAVVHCSDVRNLSTFYGDEEKATREFLQQYFKLTHCDLFFADAAILVEGNVERLLLPLLIERVAPELRACHLTILEVGGAFAHRFQKLIEFLGITTLVITDLDSVTPAAAGGLDEAARDDDDEAEGTACLADIEGAVTSNETLKQWIPALTDVAALLDLPEEKKVLAPGNDGMAGTVRVAYETRQDATWGAETKALAGRTLEEAFALQNLVWCQAPEQKHLGLRIARADKLTLDELHKKLNTRVRNLDKTRFALGVIADAHGAWGAPRYIMQGLEWLRGELQVASELPAPGDEPEVLA